jgi:excisionase family DNA binding protein
MNTDTPHRFPPAVTPLWTTTDLARYLRFTERGIYELRKQGLPAIKVGHLVRYEEAAVRAWLDKRSATLPTDGREAQLADIAAQGGDAAECAASDSFKEQLPHPAAD